ncbi:MAG: tRNA pseudouridine38-40 synthase [Bacteriovoracaceae bacterium]|jgi:tRNA pseudouridine38-40 synthase
MFRLQVALLVLVSLLNTYKLKIQYIGTSYCGWQIQPSDKTIQGSLNKVLSKISKSEDIVTLGSGRTDSGVHALGQIVKVTMPLEIGNEELLKALNSLLPQDIRVLEVKKVEESFHPIQQAKSKDYSYLFSTSRSLSVFHKPYVAEAPAGLEIKSMQKACDLFVGEHDFKDFQCVGTEVSSTVREIFSCKLEPYLDSWGPFPKEENLYMLSVNGNGFLKQMVRLIVGTLWSVGQGKVSLDDLKSSLSSPRGQKLGIVAPPNGLYLKEVFYP